MKSGIYWEVFESTGSIEAYLTFKTIESSSVVDEDGSSSNSFNDLKIESISIKENRIGSGLLVK